MVGERWSLAGSLFDEVVGVGGVFQALTPHVPPSGGVRARGMGGDGRGSTGQVQGQGSQGYCIRVKGKGSGENEGLGLTN